jgi:hypothetical protein
VIWFVRHYIAKGFAMGGCDMEDKDSTELFGWMAWTPEVAVFFHLHRLMLAA